jgi:hypothetical protein
MAEIFRPAYHVDPGTGKRVNVGTAGAVRKKSPTWWIRYYTPDGKRHKVKGYADKKATENKAAELERRGIRIDAGLVDPADIYAKKPLVEHLADFVRYLAAKGNTGKHVGLTRPCFRSWTIFANKAGASQRRTITLPLPRALPGGFGRIGGLGLIRWPACRNWRRAKRTFGTHGASWRRTNSLSYSNRLVKAGGRFAIFPGLIGSRST